MALTLVAALMLAACSTPAVALQDAGRVSATPESSFQDDYKLGVGDKIRIIVYNEESMSGEFQVNASGKIALPLIGDVQAMGKTTAELAQAVTASLAAGYLRDPRVSVEVLTYRPYFILGEVKTPAQYPYVNGMTVTNAIATAGGFTPRAAQKKVYIRRSGEDREKVYDLTPDLRVYPGDTIRLGERFF
ncbi:polysaccharide export protein [Sphingomonas sanguinis]|uniref:Polysaccharide export protein n=1 Tax=Sphingomonas sanguinis TaxID=33051 RepID=A0ABU5LPH1_9SPHN|nr:polysaccharide biosynthesis/export family protein [Sphingomonas sanguinis]MDZ7281834.1 polysaccharide export protein [Sphingomonas sanguinis]